MRVAMILPDEVAVITTDQSQAESYPPVLAQELRIFAADPYAVAILPRRRFERDVSIRIDRITGPSQKCFGKAAVGSEFGGA